MGVGASMSFGAAQAATVFCSRGAHCADGGVYEAPLSSKIWFGTAVTAVSGLGSRRGRRRLPGRFLTLHEIHMPQLYCFPVPCRCVRHRGVRYRSAFGMVHAPWDPCPLSSLKLPLPWYGPCCTFVAEGARQNLIALGNEFLAEDMEDDLSAENAIALGRRIAAFAEQLKAQYADTASKPHGRGLVARHDAVPEAKVAWVKFASFGDALTEIVLAARWLEEVGRREYGVRTRWW